MTDLAVDLAVRVLGQRVEQDVLFGALEAGDAG
jgi:hypothetical protein